MKHKRFTFCVLLFQTFFFRGTECLCFVMHSLLSLLCHALLSHFGRLILCVFFGVAHCSHPLSFLLLCASFSGLCETDVTLSIDDFPTTVTLLFCASFSGTLLLYSSCVSRSGFCVAHSCFTLPPSYRAFHFLSFFCVSHCSHIVTLLSYAFSPPRIFMWYATVTLCLFFRLNTK